MGTYSDLLQPSEPETETLKSPITSGGLQSTQKTIVPSERNSERTIFRTEQRSQQRTEKRTVKKTKPQLPIKRQTRRYSFEFYDDQLTRLRQLKIEAEMRGERIVLSVMVRDALDAYLKKID
jgi:hypothetical protein